jgi:peptidoglycan/xylan/chitin deacetylase (PgdA/CDA1 family)
MQDEDQRVPETADWRHMVAAGLYQSGLLRAFQAVSRHYEYASDNGRGEHFRRVRKAKYAVLGYHSVGTHGFPLYCRLPRQVFAAQMHYIKRHYRVLSLRQMVEELQNPRVQGQGVVVTFDDGYLGTYTEAFPILKAYGIPATVYLTSGCIESGEVPWYDQIFLRFQLASAGLTVTLDTERRFRLTDFASRVDAATTVVLYLRTLPDEERQRWCESFEEAIPVPSAEMRGWMMSWVQIREMRDAGVSIGCHTVTHPVLSRLAPDAVEREVAESKSVIENRLGSSVEDFAFPFGKARDCGTIGAKLLSDLGLRTAMTTILGINQPGTDKFRLRRMVQGDEPSIAMFAYRLQRLFFYRLDEELAAVSSAAGA